MQAVELNSIVADMFKTAYICHHYKSHENNVTDWHDRDMAQFPILDTGLQDISDCRGKDMCLRPPSAVSMSSSSDSATESNVVSCNVGDGLGSVSSITESVNSWSFRFPKMLSVISAADDAADEKSTLLIDNRRQNVASSADTAVTSLTQSEHLQVGRAAESILFSTFIVHSTLLTRFHINC